ncbi:hypothetical protein V3851_00160 [Paenibacillus sp. M1]|uniref:Uncharacterized protein n=1 Tax=Paenibacillus haidiansis TaxID=1574488 RepID=A0ABU7VKD8_9BACL
MMLKRNGTAIAFVLYAVVLIASLTVYISLLPFNLFSSSFWLSLVTLILAETAVWFYAHYWIQNYERVNRMIPGYTGLGVIVVGYLAAVIVYSLLSDAFLPGAYTILHILTLAAAVVIGGIILIFINFTAAKEEETREQVAALHEMEAALKRLLGKLPAYEEPQLSELKSVLAQLIEKVKYSDPVTPESLQMTDQQMLYQIHLLDEELSNAAEGDIEAPPFDLTLRRLRELGQSLTLRNEQVLISK